jgi:hypothetical protein
MIGDPADPKAGSVYSYINAQKYLSSEGVFNGLTDGGTKKGIFPVYDKVDDNGNQIIKVDDYGNPIIKDLYINASYISTGILRSNNWEGSLKYSKDEGKTWSDSLSIEEAEAKVADKEASWDDTWSLNATKGTYWNLNDGKLWASKFELSAWKNNVD